MINRRCPGERQITVGADKGYDMADFVADLRAMNATPHVAAKVKGSAVDGRTMRHAGYAVSQRKRKRIEEAFAGEKLSAPPPKRCCAALPASASSSRSIWPPTISPACPSCLPHETGMQPTNTPSPGPLLTKEDASSSTPFSAAC